LIVCKRFFACVYDICVCNCPDTVTNRHRRAVDIVVLESSPVGRNEAVEIERRFIPAASEESWNGQKGVIAWKQTLGAGQDANFAADYRIRWPKDRQVIGLP
jgi:hypothetical protein